MSMRWGQVNQHNKSLVHNLAALFKRQRNEASEEDIRSHYRQKYVYRTNMVSPTRKLRDTFKDN